MASGSQFGDSLFGNILFADVGFSTELSWRELCPEDRTFVPLAAAVNPWNNQSINAGGWQNQAADKLPTIRCQRVR